MVSLEQIRSYMRTQIEEDKKKKYIQVSADSLEDALKEASIELGVKVKKLEYEVLEKGAKGTFGIGKKKWMIVASQVTQLKTGGEFDESIDIDFGFDGEEEEVRDRDGEAFVRLAPEGVLLRVTKPNGSGKKVTERMAVEILSQKTSGKLDMGMVSRVVKLADDEFIKVADIDYNPANDSILNVDITDGEMKAYLLAHPPGEGGTDPTIDTIVTFLQVNGVQEGLKQDVLEAFEREPVYNQPVLIAEGAQPKNGDDAKILYDFQSDAKKANLKEKDGKVDFKELNLIQNVVEGQILAKKVPAERGEAGRTVTGLMIPAKDGKDVEILVGKNVKLASDGMTAVSEINGQVILAANKINVEPIFVVEGDVNLKTGNILFLGTVIVKGNVDDGFSVKAAGNIEVMGSVGRCELDAEGDVVVHQGITGKNSGSVKCGQSIWSKFIENTHIESGELVVVSDGIINSNVSANKKIICKGKRASIVGGHLRASEEINAKTLGSVAGMETILEVGFDPQSKEQLDELNGKKDDIQTELDDLSLNLSTLENMKKTRKKLPEEKEKALKELTQKKAELVTSLNSVKSEIEEIHNYLSQLKTRGKISASATVFPGVKVYIKDAFLEVRNEFKAVTFISEANTVKVTKYEETEEDITRK